MTLKPTAIAATLLFATVAIASSPEDLVNQSAGDDMDVLQHHVESLSEMAEEHISAVGLAQAIVDFQDAPWLREANGLHLWGSNSTGVHWFDAGHPEVVGLNVAAMSDLEGRNWWELALAAATGEGERTFMLVFPHPQTQRAARGLHSCFMLEDEQRFLCAGAFEDPA